MAGSAGKVARKLNFVRFLWQFNIQIDSKWMANRQEIICEKRFMTFWRRRTKLIINGGYEDKPKISFNYIKFNTFGIILMKDSLTSADCIRQVFNKAAYSLPLERRCLTNFIAILPSTTTCLCRNEYELSSSWRRRIE